LAVVIRAGYFCTAGYTEAGGIKALLEKIHPDIAWERCFPAFDKPAPKLGRPLSTPRAEDSGTTGRALVDRMMDRLAKYYHGEACSFDVVVLIDDADCRFKAPDADAARWSGELLARVRAAVERPALGFVALFASPEIETWLLADWAAGFGEEYAEIAAALRVHLERGILGPPPWRALEDYGGAYDPGRGSCAQKLSDDLNTALDQLAAAAGGEVAREAYTYSKKVNGPRMLQRIRPEEVATLCTTYFEPAYRALRELVEAAPLPLPAASPPSEREQRAPPPRRLRPTPGKRGSRR
jgi:hypothetical protein